MLTSVFGASMITLTGQIKKGLQDYIGPLVDLLIRLWIAKIFFNSGLVKINSWENTLFLFEYEYMVPLLPFEVSAFLATATELIMSAFLAIGFLTRLSALPLLSMALVIQFILGANNAAYDHIEHYYWMMLLLVVISKGPGKLSVDHLLCKRICS